MFGGACYKALSPSALLLEPYNRLVITLSLLHLARYDLMEGDKLSNKAAPRIDATRLFKDSEARRAKLHKSAKTLTLEEAFVALEAQRGPSI